jgi:hypothetical protein
MDPSFFVITIITTLIILILGYLIGVGYTNAAWAKAADTETYKECDSKIYRVIHMSSQRKCETCGSIYFSKRIKNTTPDQTIPELGSETPVAGKLYFWVNLIGTRFEGHFKEMDNGTAIMLINGKEVAVSDPRL